MNAGRWVWGWYGERFIITQENEQGSALRQIAMPREDAERMFKANALSAETAPQAPPTTEPQ